VDVILDSVDDVELPIELSNDPAEIRERRDSSSVSMKGLRFFVEKTMCVRMLL
jgi:hypothetical protein